MCERERERKREKTLVRITGLIHQDKESNQGYGYFRAIPYNRNTIGELYSLRDINLLVIQEESCSS